MEDIRSKKIVFLPFCALSQVFASQGIVKNWSSSIKPIVQLLLDNDINIVQMTCPESSFNGYDANLIRAPKNIEGYDINEYRDHCKNLVDLEISRIKACLSSGYQIIAIVGIENSPSCAVSYVQSDNGEKVTRKGVYFTLLEEELKKQGLELPFVGIYKKDVSKALFKLEELIKNS